MFGRIVVVTVRGSVGCCLTSPQLIFNRGTQISRLNFHEDNDDGVDDGYDDVDDVYISRPPKA